MCSKTARGLSEGQPPRAFRLKVEERTMDYPIRTVRSDTDDQSVSLKTTWQHMLSDLGRYRVTEQRSYPEIFVLSPAVFAGLYYRIGHWIWYYRGWLATLVLFLRPIYIIFKR